MFAVNQSAGKLLIFKDCVYMTLSISLAKCLKINGCTLSGPDALLESKFESTILPFLQ